MRLYSGKIPGISEEILHKLVENEFIEVENIEEASDDVSAVLKEYLRRERSVTEEAKDRMQRAGLGYSHLGKMRAQVAKERRAPTQDDVIPYLVNQVLNMLFHSQHVEEIFAEDTDLRRTITAVLRKNMNIDGELDREVRSKIKNLEEGTSVFEVEYARVMDQVKKQKRIE